MPASDGGDDFVGIGSPDEGPGLLIVLVDEAVDGGLKVDHGVEHAILQPSTALSHEHEVARSGRSSGDAWLARREPWAACAWHSYRG